MEMRPALSTPPLLSHDVYAGRLERPNPLAPILRPRLHALCCHPGRSIQHRHTDQLLVTVAQQEPLIGQLRIGGFLWACKAHVEHIGLLVVVHPKMCGGKSHEQGDSLCNDLHERIYGFLHTICLRSSLLVKYAVMMKPSSADT